jgi:hypothetical protein
MAGVVLVAVIFARPKMEDEAIRRSLAVVMATVLAVTALALTASFRGTFVMSSGWGDGLTPQVRDIWAAVRQRVPPDALVFTDQTGRNRNLLGGWNTYAFHGQRQVFLSTWFQSHQLQANPDLREARLRTNDDVLAGRLNPTTVQTRVPYGSFFAVVAAGRQLSPRWRMIYANRDYALYRWTD